MPIAQAKTEFERKYIIGEHTYKFAHQISPHGFFYKKKTKKTPKYGFKILHTISNATVLRFKFVAKILNCVSSTKNTRIYAFQHTC